VGDFKKGLLIGLGVAAAIVVAGFVTGTIAKAI
jgi:hypothetical protein